MGLGTRTSVNSHPLCCSSVTSKQSALGPWNLEFGEIKNKQREEAGREGILWGVGWGGGHSSKQKFRTAFL